MMPHSSVDTPPGGVERRKGISLRWDPTVGAGAVIQVCTVVGTMAVAVAVILMNISSTQTKYELGQARIEQTMKQNQDDNVARDNTNQQANVKAIADLKTDMFQKMAEDKAEQARSNGELSGSLKEQAAKVTQLQSTMDQTVPRSEDRFASIIARLAGYDTRWSEADQFKIDTKSQLFILNQFKAQVENASPSAKHGG